MTQEIEKGVARADGEDKKHQTETTNALQLETLLACQDHRVCLATAAQGNKYSIQMTSLKKIDTHFSNNSFQHTLKGDA